MPRIVTQTRFERTFAKHSRQANNIVKKLANKDLDAEQFGDAFDALLWKAHTDAITLGRKRAGDYAPQHEDDQNLALDIKDSDADYLNSFIDDIKSGRYTLEDGSLNADAIQSRAQLYIRKTRGSANESFVNASDDDDYFIWQLGFTEHCSDCIDLAAGSPYSKDELWTYPGQGDTVCLGNCACNLQRVSDGRKGFERAF